MELLQTLSSNQFCIQHPCLYMNHHGRVRKSATKLITPVGINPFTNLRSMHSFSMEGLYLEKALKCSVAVNITKCFTWFMFLQYSKHLIHNDFLTCWTSSLIVWACCDARLLSECDNSRLFLFTRGWFFNWFFVIVFIILIYLTSCCDIQRTYYRMISLSDDLAYFARQPHVYHLLYEVCNNIKTHASPTANKCQ